MKYAAIADWAQEKKYSVTFMCAELCVTRQGYYRRLAQGPCQRQRTDAELTEAILAIHTELDGHAACAGSGPSCSPAECGSDLSGSGGLRGRHPRACKKDHHRRPAARRCAGSDRAGLHRRSPHTRWCGDITSSALAEQDGGSERECREMRVPVALAQGQPTEERIYGKLCIPSGRSPDTIQLLVHGGVYTGIYWEFPDPSGGSDRYNYAAAANRAGFATLAIGRIGSGRSSHPLSTKITLESNAFTVHQVVQAIRRGEITSPDGKQFHKVVYVGHSYGTLVGWILSTDYGEGIDAAVFTGNVRGATVTAVPLLYGILYPAALDPKFAGDGLDSGYLTTLQGTRDEFLYKPARFDPAVVEFDEKTKSTSTATELTAPGCSPTCRHWTSGCRRCWSTVSSTARFARKTSMHCRQ